MNIHISDHDFGVKCVGLSWYLGALRCKVRFHFHVGETPMTIALAQPKIRLRTFEVTLFGLTFYPRIFRTYPAGIMWKDLNGDDLKIALEKKAHG